VSTYDSLISASSTIHPIPSAPFLQPGNTLPFQFLPRFISLQTLPFFGHLRSIDFDSVAGCLFWWIIHLEILNHQPFRQQRIHFSWTGNDQPHFCSPFGESWVSREPRTAVRHLMSQIKILLKKWNGTEDLKTAESIDNNWRQWDGIISDNLWNDWVSDSDHLPKERIIYEDFFSSCPGNAGGSLQPAFRQSRE
jgi:hypothetical protein